MPDKEKLFTDFSPVSTKEWLDRIYADLKGEDFEKKLVWKNVEGLEILPFYRQEDIDGLGHITSLPGELPFARSGNMDGNGWLVRQDIMVDDIRNSNRKALDILMKGVDSVGFVLSGPSIVSPANIENLLEDILIDAAEICFRTPGKARELLGILKALTDRRGLDEEKIRGAVEADPLGRLLINGNICVPLEEGFEYLAGLIKESAGLPSFRVMEVNGSLFSNAGADTVTELAFTLSMGNEYLSQLTRRNVHPDSVASKMRFCFGTGSNYFFEIAKLRAARILWSLITGKYDSVEAQNRRMQIHSVTTRWNKSAFDPYVNLLRTQTEAMSAVLGGADSVTVEPFDKVFSTPGEFSERLARNQQLLLREEAYFDRVADPAGGSYYIEKLTSLIAEKAWKLFVDTEKMGGFLECIRKGFIQKSVKEIALKRVDNISRRKEILVGLNQYPDPSETLSEAMIATRTESGRDNEEKPEIVEPLKLFRGPEKIEKLRQAALLSERRPVVYLLPIGNTVMRRARAQFSFNLFGCGGYRVIDNPGFSSVAEGVKDASVNLANIIVVCSSDEEYPVYAPQVLEMAGSETIVVVAGNPPSCDELKQKGIQHFISIRSDLAETIGKFHRLTGVIVNM